MDEWIIRTTIRPGDIGTIIEAHGRIYSREYEYTELFEAYVAEGLAEFIFAYDPERSHSWVCEADGKIVGAIVLVDRGDRAQLRYFYLEQNYRGKGIGKQLMQNAIDFARAKQYSSVYLWTASELIDAARLYKQFGFELSAEKQTDAFGKTVVEQQYTLTL